MEEPRNDVSRLNEAKRPGLSLNCLRGSSDAGYYCYRNRVCAIGRREHALPFASPSAWPRTQDTIPLTVVVCDPWLGSLASVASARLSVSVQSVPSIASAHRRNDKVAYDQYGQTRVYESETACSRSRVTHISPPSLPRPPMPRRTGPTTSQTDTPPKRSYAIERSKRAEAAHAFAPNRSTRRVIDRSSVASSVRCVTKTKRG